MKYIDKLKRVEKKVARLKGKNKSLLLGGKGGKNHFICDPGGSRYEPGALMKRTEYPANTLTGPR